LGQLQDAILSASVDVYGLIHCQNFQSKSWRNDLKYPKYDKCVSGWLIKTHETMFIKNGLGATGYTQFISLQAKQEKNSHTPV
jgi:hypothetical protein